MRTLFAFVFMHVAVSWAQCDMEILSFDPESMDISIAVNSGENCGSPTDSIGEFLLGLTTSPQLEEYPYPCFYDNGWALLVYPISFPLVNVNAPGAWLQSGDTISFNVVDAFIAGSDASLCWEEAINDGFFQDECWVIAITQINDSYSWPYESNTGLGDFEYPDTYVENNSVQFSPTNPDCNPDFEGYPDPCEDPSVWLPTAFTPNGDGKNEAFKPVITSAPECWFFWDFKIYNRWGSVVFDSNYPGQQWLGDSGRQPRQHYVPDGIYVWHLKARHRYGEWYDMHGHVTIMR